MSLGILVTVPPSSSCSCYNPMLLLQYIVEVFKSLVQDRQVTLFLAILQNVYLHIEKQK
jgi:hypothetical protein